MKKVRFLCEKHFEKKYNFKGKIVVHTELISSISFTLLLFGEAIASLHVLVKRFFLLSVFYNNLQSI